MNWNIVLVVIAALVFGIGMFYVITENESLKEQNRKLCNVSNQLVETINMESKYINKYCGSSTLTLPNVSYVECEQ